MVVLVGILDFLGIKEGNESQGVKSTTFGNN